jgi:hypothetical protein
MQSTFALMSLRHGKEINKPLHSNGHLSIVAHVGGSHTVIEAKIVLN